MRWADGWTSPRWRHQRAIVATLVLGGLTAPVSRAENHGYPDAHDPPPPGWTGPIFKLSQDYPENEPASEAYPWLAFDFRQPAQTGAYLRAVLDYAREGNEEHDWRVEENSLRRWYHAPWMHYGSSGREFIHGLTRERNSRPRELHPQQASIHQNWAVSLYNDRGGYVIGRVWSDPTNPQDAGVLFPEGTVSVKLLFTSAPSSEVPFLVNAPEWQAQIHATVAETETRSVQTVRLLQIDVAIKDSRFGNPTGWVFGTFIYNGDVTHPAPFDRMVPVGLMWGNDPGVTPEQVEAGSATIQESLLTDEARPLMQHYGWAGRLNGPVDNPRSSCLSCHSTAESPPGTPMIPPNGVDPLPWFQNIPAGVPFTAGKRSLDYSLQLAKGIENFRATVTPPLQAVMNDNLAAAQPTATISREGTGEEPGTVGAAVAESADTAVVAEVMPPVQAVPERGLAPDAVPPAAEAVPPLGVAAQSFSGRVVQVHDGDTIRVRDSQGRSHRVRIFAIDAPEIGQPAGDLARQALRDWLRGETVEVRPTGAVSYGRRIARVYAEGDVLVGLEMVRDGWAWHYRDFDDSSEFRHAESDAREQGIGLWGFPNPIAPWDWRRGRRDVVGSLMAPEFSDSVARATEGVIGPVPLQDRTIAGFPRVADSERFRFTPSQAEGVVEGLTVLHKRAFSLGHFDKHRLPAWVAMRWTADDFARSEEVNFGRPSPSPDDELPAYARGGTNFDFARTMLERGHMARDADVEAWGFSAVAQAVLMSNMVPQRKSRNHAVWSLLENEHRRVVVDEVDEFDISTVWLTAGPVYFPDQDIQRLPSGTSRPHATYKLVAWHKQDGSVAARAYLIDQNATNTELTTYLRSVDAVERLTGLDFFPDLSDDTEDLLEGEEHSTLWE